MEIPTKEDLDRVEQKLDLLFTKQEIQIIPTAAVNLHFIEYNPSSFPWRWGNFFLQGENIQYS
ncbi:hypothetical protein [uncultured Sphaerochaeta sp.]|uniref:hypothetical protein n=1 Tax=uncultured Sphaerochaeta sp. TaxID=886478 RepID=UPI002A0A7D77|nr:hypothetical protein [uncultured Sphaerochaeta sp.]